MTSTVARHRVCLIVDNPLRDLDGLVLVAFELARRGVEAILVPMYEQVFDVPALRPDLVLVNYVRANNRDAVRLYREQGIRIGVLDTEGAGGKSAGEFAALVKSTIEGTAVDLYCVWGEAQYAAFRAQRVVPETVLRLTGCPRYDFCAAPWRETLPAADTPGYVLINTNFPTVNPKFSSGAGDERAAMIKAGFSAEFAERYVAAAHRAQREIIELIGRLVRRLPALRFVLRPHPFESTAPYRSLESGGNLRVIQSGTSLQWLKDCCALLHLNCSTALEAVMLGREPVTPQWINEEVLSVPIAQAVSRCAGDENALAALLSQAAEGSMPAADASLRDVRDRSLRDPYFRIDGLASARVADAVVESIRSPLSAGSARVSLRGRLVSAARRGLGYRLSTAAKALVPSRRRAPNVAAAKAFSLDAVRDLLGRLARVSGSPEPGAEWMRGGRRLSGLSIRISSRD